MSTTYLSCIAIAASGRKSVFLVWVTTAYLQTQSDRRGLQPFESVTQGKPTPNRSGDLIFHLEIVRQS